MMNCKQCGKLLDTALPFCKNCGAAAEVTRSPNAEAGFVALPAELPAKLSAETIVAEPRDLRADAAIAMSADSRVDADEAAPADSHVEAATAALADSRADAAGAGGAQPSVATAAPIDSRADAATITQVASGQNLPKVPKSTAVRLDAVFLALLAVATFTVNQQLLPQLLDYVRAEQMPLLSNSLGTARALAFMLLAALGLSFASRLRWARRPAARYHLDSVGDMIAGCGLLLYALMDIAKVILINAGASSSLSNYSIAYSVVEITQALLPATLFVVAIIFFLRGSHKRVFAFAVGRLITLLAAAALFCIAATEMFRFILPAMIGSAVTATPEYVWGFELLENGRISAVLVFLLLRCLYWLVVPGMAKKLPIR